MSMKQPAADATMQLTSKRMKPLYPLRERSAMKHRPLMMNIIAPQADESTGAVRTDKRRRSRSLSP